jgi:ribosomal protein S18 acetylase RimI-like enzyme
MAAMSETRIPALVDLRSVRAAQLDNLLHEEVDTWGGRLDWDFEPTAALVRRFAGMQALEGFALGSGSEIFGYTYFVCEDTKGLVGDLYILQDYRCAEYEDRLLEAALGAMFDAHGLRRVEAQLLLLPGSLDRPLPFAARLRRHRRDFMVITADAVRELAPRDQRSGFTFETWTPRRQEQAAGAIAAAYRGHIDGEINDQYRSVSGARRFLLNIVQYPGCGSFFTPGSVLAIRAGGGEACGICLASLVSRGVGHITQICVTPEYRGRGLGYELLRRSLVGLAAHGCRQVTLTVTSANAEARQLYERSGFRTLHSFAALVWEAPS